MPDVVPLRISGQYLSLFMLEKYPVTVGAFSANKNCLIDFGLICS